MTEPVVLVVVDGAGGGVGVGGVAGRGRPDYQSSFLPRLLSHSAFER